MPLQSLLVFALAVASGAQPSWPIMYSYSPDSMPIMEVRLAPPRKPMPEVVASLGELENNRLQFETEELLKVERAYNVSLVEAGKKLPALVDRLMRVFVKPGAWIATRHGVPLKSRAASFHEAHGSGGHEITTRINLLPVVSADASLERSIQKLERKRSRDERALFMEAEDEMEMWTQVVEIAAEAEITQEVNAFIRAQKYGSSASAGELLTRGRATKFLGQPVSPSGPQLSTNVRVAASDEPFPTIESMVEDLERKRDVGEGFLRTRMLELELQLLQAENAIISERLRGWVEHILQTSV